MRAGVGQRIEEAGIAPGARAELPDARDLDEFGADPLLDLQSQLKKIFSGCTMGLRKQDKKMSVLSIIQFRGAHDRMSEVNAK